jgi:hypothetical protein
METNIDIVRETLELSKTGFKNTPMIKLKFEFFEFLSFRVSGNSKNSKNSKNR